jgi:16S rRNA (cytosine1402-N4)-methyltransferase
MPTDDEEPPPARPLRRTRYRGRNPRAFNEKYKELKPDRYAADVAKVIASGKTPAGMHRPIMVPEILDVLAPAPPDFAVDATLGYGGHAQELLKAILPGGRLLALDVDPIELPKAEARLRALDLPADSLIARRSNFAGLSRVLSTENLPPADIVLADLGVSSMQLDDPSRGFTFKHAGPLDLRMNPRRGQPASAWLASFDKTTLTRALRDNADEPDAEVLAEAILDAHRRTPITTTIALADVVAGAVSGPDESKQSSVRRVFQALRVAVNEEFGALDTFLRLLPECLKAGGRVAILSFHSGEDRRVKRAFRDGFDAGVYSRVADEVIRPGVEERRANPRSSAAKLRWAVRG